MTRVNCVHVQELSREHLVAEYRETPRLFNLVRAAQARGGVAAAYREAHPIYVLGPGHVKFFYGRLTYVVKRCVELTDEMVRRGYAPQFSSGYVDVSGIDDEWFGDWTPTDEALKANWARIKERTR